MQDKDAELTLDGHSAVHERNGLRLALAVSHPLKLSLLRMDFNRDLLESSSVLLAGVGTGLKPGV